MKLPYPVIQIIKIISEAVFTHLGNFQTIELYAFASSYTYSWHYLVDTGLKIQLINKTTSGTTPSKNRGSACTNVRILEITVHVNGRLV